MHEPDMATSYRLRVDDLVWRKVEHELIVLDLSGSKYLSLNDTGSYLWERLTVGAAEGELVDSVVAEFAVEREVATVDVSLFLRSLEVRGLLAVVE